MRYSIRLLLTTLLWLAGFHLIAQISKVSEPGVYAGYNDPKYDGFTYSSVYIQTSDSVKLAADIFLPKKLGKDERVPTILYLTRYVRTFQAKVPFRWLQDPVFGQIKKEEIEFFTSHGYACVIVDVRGTGASFGTRRMEFSPEEIRDGGEVVDWIIAQPWSNGRVGSTGISYLGTTAEMLLVNQHPAVKACVPRSSIFDLYNDIAYPGGIRHGKFIEVWRNTTYALDNNQLDFISKKAGRLLSGPHPVDGDKRKRLYRQAKAEHEGNFDIFQGMFKVYFRNEPHPDIGLPIDHFSVHSYKDKIEGSGTPIYRIGGWYDGGLANSAIKGYLSTANSVKLLIGPWDHGPAQNVSPFQPDNTLKFDVLTEILRFFDFYLKDIDNGIDREPPICFYRMGAEQWEFTTVWPPEDVKNDTMFFSKGASLTARISGIQPDTRHYRVIDTLGTGGGSRWNSLTVKYRYTEEIGYPDRREINEKMLYWDSPPLEEAMELTGHPVISIVMSADSPDVSLFAYIEDVAPDGSVTYVTEGLLRAINRKVSTEEPPYPMFGPYHTFHIEDTLPLIPNQPDRIGWELIPVSYRFGKNHRIRVSLACSDIDHFDLPPTQADNITVYSTPRNPSFLVLPLRKPAETTAD